MVRYIQRQDGEWILYLTDTKIACCDCGLVHRLEIKHEGGVTLYNATRDNRATGQRRRWLPAKLREALR